MAITLAEAINVNGSGVATFTSACAANDLIVVYGGTPQSSLVAATASDSVNTGAYSSVSSLFNSGAGKQVSVFYKKCNAAGTPVVTCTGGAQGLGIAMRFTGFTVGPTIAVPDQAVGWPGTSTTAVSSGSTSASQNAELFVALQSSGQNNASGGAGWTSAGVFANTGIAAFYQTGIASGTAESFTATLSAADFPYALIQGFFDGTAASPVIPSLGFFGSGPGPRGPFNNNQFRSFPFSAQPLSANAWIATLAEAGGAVDSLTSAQVMLASLAEAGAANDAVTATLAMSLALAEAGAAADSLVSVAAFASSLSTAGAATDALTSTWAAVAALAEAGSALDAYVNALAMSASLTEAGTAADSAANGSLYTATLAEAGTATDSATAVSVLSASLAEAGTAAAAINATLTAALALSEAASAVDALGLSVNLNASVSEAGAALDAFVTALTFNAALLEAGFALDALAANQSSGSLFPTRLLTTGFYTQLLASQAGALPYGEFFTYKGDVLVYGIDWAGFLANYWQRGGLVAAGFAIRPTNPTGFQLATVLGGQSGSTEPVCPTTIGQTVQDGSVLWVCQAVDTTSLSATVASVTWAPAVGITVATQSIAGQLTIAKIDASAATAGQKYAVDAHVLMSDGETKTGRIVLKVS